MKITIDSIFNTAKSVMLTPEEKSKLDEALMLHMQEFPYEGSTTSIIESPYGHTLKYKGYSFVTFFNANKRNALSVAVVLVLSVTLGTSFVAAEALPGDLLYPLKIHINEPLELAIAPTTEAKAAVNTKQALRRLDEAKALLEQGRLDATTTSEIQVAFNKKVEEATKNIEELSNTKNYQAALKSNKELQDGLHDHYTSLLMIHDEEDDISHQNEFENTIESSATSTPEQIKTSAIDKEIDVNTNKKNIIKKHTAQVKRDHNPSFASSTIPQDHSVLEVVASTTEYIQEEQKNETRHGEKSSAILDRVEKKSNDIRKKMEDFEKNSSSERRESVEREEDN